MAKFIVIPSSLIPLDVVHRGEGISLNYIILNNKYKTQVLLTEWRVFGLEIKFVNLLMETECFCFGLVLADRSAILLLLYLLLLVRNIVLRLPIALACWNTEILWNMLWVKQQETLSGPHPWTKAWHPPPKQCRSDHQDLCTAAAPSIHRTWALCTG